MTDDLVKQLRNDWTPIYGGCVGTMFDAANRIEQLELYLAEAQRCLDVKDYEGAIIMCRAALGEKKDGN
jgi:glycyl-tRNA synthetase beta subunit